MLQGRLPRPLAHSARTLGGRPLVVPGWPWAKRLPTMGSSPASAERLSLRFLQLTDYAAPCYRPITSYEEYERGRTWPRSESGRR